MSAANFSQAQIALALVVLRSTPVGLSIEDYIHFVRKSINEQTSNKSIDTQHYIDATTFWREAFEKVEAEKNELLDKLSALSYNNESQDRPLPRHTATPLAKSGGRVLTKANTQSKRRKLESEEANKQPLLNLEDDISPTLTGHRSLLRAVRMVRTELTGEAASADKLSVNMKVAAQILRQAFQTILKNSATQLDAAESETLSIESGLRVIPKVWNFLLNAAKETNEPSTSDTNFLPDMVCLFQVSLGRIQQLCLDEADRQLKSQKRQSKLRSRVGSAGLQTHSNRGSAHRTCSLLADISCRMLKSLDPRCSVHNVLYEGIMCALLDHIGSSVSLLIFAEPSVSMDKQRGLLPPVGLTDVAHLDSASALLTSQIAGPYLVLILRQAVAISDAFDREHNLSRRQGKSSPANENSGTLLATFKEKLQNTLLRGIFGDEEGAFESALDRCEEAEDIDAEEVLQSYEKQEDKSQWFIGQVWEHLGWDILSAD